MSRCPTITALHAILAAHEAPQGPSKANTIKAVAACLSGVCAPAATRYIGIEANAELLERGAVLCAVTAKPVSRDDVPLYTQPVAGLTDRDKLLSIIASAYVIAGHHDAPEHILDVLSDPEAATAAQVDAMLPYQVAAQGEQDALIAALEGEHAACDWLMARLIALDPFFKPTTSPAWPAIAAGSAAILAAKGGTQ